mgnify:CR=1 FL=1
MAEGTEIYEVATDEGLQFCFARNDDSCIIDTIYDTMYNASREVFIMSKWDKLLLRIRNLSKDLRFDELKKSNGELWLYNECTERWKQSLYV